MIKIDWPKVRFDYIRTPWRFHCTFRQGAWEEGALTDDQYVRMHEGSTVLHYGQGCFEGLKAQRSKKGTIYIFRPNENLKRFNTSIQRLMGPEMPGKLFYRAIDETIKANREWIPPYGPEGHGCTMYIRPFLMGVGENIGVHPSHEYIFRVFCLPVGMYYNPKQKFTLEISDYDRCPPEGTGSVKVCGNYAGGLLPAHEVRQAGAGECLYLDPIERRYVLETNSSNLILLLKSGEMVAPSFRECILPSITQKSVLTIAQKEYGFKVRRRRFDYWAEKDNILEIGACGTAAILTPVAAIMDHDGELKLKSGAKNATMLKLRDHLCDIQVGKRAAPKGSDS